jgi:hypothetical protein
MVSFRSHWQIQLRKVLSNFHRNLTIRHLVNRFNTHYASTEVAFFKTFLQFALCLTRTKYQNGFSITKTCNYRLVKNFEMPRKRSLAAIICRNYLCFIRSLKRRITRTSELFFNLRYYQTQLFPCISNSYDNGLPMVNPQTYFCSHRFLLCLLHFEISRSSLPPGLPRQ